MFAKFFERKAALKDTRVQTFLNAKLCYEKFLTERGIPFGQTGELDYQHAVNDERIQAARKGFAEAAEMSRNQGVLVDEAIAWYQLGMVCHACGDLDESKTHMQVALAILQSLTIEERPAVRSGCHYHLGVIAWKQKNDNEAVRHLLESRRIDESLMNFSGMQVCDALLAQCDQQKFAGELATEPAEADEQCSGKTDSGDGQSSGAPLEYEADDYDDFEEDEILAKPTRVRYNQRQLIWLASYSVKANDRLMTHLEMIGDDFGRPVAISRVAFGATNEEQASLSMPEKGQHLCAAILVLDKQSIYDRGFQQLTALCVEQVLDRADFRLLVYLDGLSIDDLRDLQKSDPFIKNLFDTTQIAQLPSLKQLRNTLVPFVRRVERIQAMEWWRHVRLSAASAFGKIATTMLVGAAVFSLLGFPAWLANLRLDEYMVYGRELSALLLGLLAFPVQAPFLFIILRGLRKTSVAPQENKLFLPWAVAGGIILVGSSHLQYSHDGPTSWVILGVVAGVILDTLRRGGYQARREMIDVSAYSRAAAESNSSEQKRVNLQESPFNPFTCQILPSLSNRIFISYSRSSAKGSRIARELFTRLKEARTAPFLDRASIPAGTSWRRTLNRQIGECDVFICLLDGTSIQRDWVAAEMTAAIEGAKTTSAPHIIVLADPEIQRLPSETKSVFQAIMTAEKQLGVAIQPRIVYMNDKTVESVAWDLQPGLFVSTAVFPRFAAKLVMLPLALLGFLGGLGMIMGFLLGFFAALEKSMSFPFSTWIVSHGLEVPVVLFSGLWLGWTLRTAVTWKFEEKFFRDEGLISGIIASTGLVFVLILLLPETSLYIALWSAVLIISGWMNVAALVHSAAARKKAK